MAVELAMSAAGLHNVTHAIIMDAGKEYESRRSAWSERARQFADRDLRIAILRGITFASGVVLFFLPISRWWLALPFVVFILLAILHEIVINRRKNAKRAVAFYERALDRIEDRWIGRGNSGDRYFKKSHAYSNDLDIFGRASLFELLCLAQTRGGEKKLAGWLLTQASIDTIPLRQEAVIELRTKHDFREKLALTGGEIRSELKEQDLLTWSAIPEVQFPIKSLILLSGIGLASLSCLIGWVFWEMSSLPFLAILAVELLILRWSRESILLVTTGAEHAHDELRLLSRVLSNLEREKFTSESLSRLQKSLRVEGGFPSQRIARLARLLELLESSKNQFFAPLAIVLLWNPILALELERWRIQCAPRLPDWIDAVAEVEALSSFAWYSFEHPKDVFPEISNSTPLFDAQELGHPLISESRCVRNDVQLNLENRLLIVSGSNMSGKSTLLRSIGLNAVLALSGAPVRASSLTISALSVGASIRVVDSLQDGTSRFYEEIKRLKLLMDLAESSPPLLFLLDEILHGTNSVDRSIGAEALVRGFLSRGAFGLITTHDLALTNMAKEFAPEAQNVHFEDQAKDGSITFDYKLRSGVVSKSNAIALMRSIGLDV